MRRITAVVAMPILTIPLLSACVFVPLGPPETQDRQIKNVSAVSLEVRGDLTITPGEPSLTITAASGVIDALTADIDNGVLHLGVRPGVRIPWGDVHYTLSLPTLESVTIAGAGDVTAEFDSADTVTILIEGSGDIEATNIDADLVSVVVEGSGNVELSGSAARFETSIEGAGDIDAEDLEARDVVASIEGAGGMRITATATLDASISGAGTIRYSGGALVTREIDGVGEIAAD